MRGVIERPILAMESKIYDFKQASDRAIKPLSYWRSGERELMRLQGELRQLAVESSQLSVCLEENERMRALLGAPLPPQWKFLSAKVVGMTEKMKIDKGRRDGVREGMMVVSENILVGKVVSVEERSALVQLPTDPASKIPVVVKKPGSLGVQARGLLLPSKEGLIVDRILQTEDVREGDLVLTEGEGWLPDLLIGQIQEVLGQEAAIYKQARVSPLIDYETLRIVFVVVQ